MERAQTQSQNAHLARDLGQPLTSPSPALFTYLMKWSVSSTLPFCPHPPLPSDKMKRARQFSQKEGAGRWWDLGWEAHYWLQGC